MEIVLDERLFIGPENVEQKKILMSEMGDPASRCVFTEIPLKNTSTRAEFVAIAGLGLAAITTIVSLMTFFKDSSKEISSELFANEVRAYLEVRGITDFKFEKWTHAEHFIAGSGRPSCVVYRENSGKEIRVYFGVKNSRIWVSASEPNWRQLTN